MLGASGTSICMCPTTERDLGDGLGHAAELASAGSPLVLGSDSHAVIDMFEEARAVELDDRLRLGKRDIHDPAVLLDGATTAGARSLGWESVGLAPGGPADFIAVDVDTLRMAAWEPHEGIGPLIFGAAACDVTDVVVAGRRIVAGGEHADIEVLDELRGALRDLREVAH